MTTKDQVLEISSKQVIDFLILFAIALLLSSCGGGGAGNRDTIEGDRYSVLTFEQQLKVDPQVTNVQIVLPKPHLNENWAQAGGNMQHIFHHLEISDNPKKIWSSDIGEGSGGRKALVAEPVVKGGVLYAIDASAKITALNADTGRRIWEKRYRKDGETEMLGYGGGVTVGESALYFVNGYGQFGALNLTDGSEIWLEDIAVPMRGSPTYADGRVFGVTLDNHIFALNAENGEIIWDEVGISENAGLAGSASPAVIGNTVIVSYSSGEVYAMRVENGRILWTDTLNRQGQLTAMATLRDIDGHPVVYDGNVYLISHSGRMAAVNIRSGIRVWEQNVGSQHTPWVSGEFIYVVTTNSEVICMTRRDGRIIWITQLERFADPEIRKQPVHWHGPVVASDRVIVTSSHGYAITLSPYTGNVTGGMDLPDGAGMGPVVANGALYFLVEDGDIVALR